MRNYLCMPCFLTQVYSHVIVVSSSSTFFNTTHKTCDIYFVMILYVVICVTFTSLSLINKISHLPALFCIVFHMFFFNNCIAYRWKQYSSLLKGEKRTNTILKMCDIQVCQSCKTTKITKTQIYRFILWNIKVNSETQNVLTSYQTFFFQQWDKFKKNMCTFNLCPSDYSARSFMIVHVAPTHLHLFKPLQSLVSSSFIIFFPSWATVCVWF